MIGSAVSSSIIGGMFGLESGEQPGDVATTARSTFLTLPRIELASARAAFGLLADFLRPKTVWLPSYLCGVILRSLSEPDARIRYYAVDDRLRFVDDRWLDSIEQGDMTVFIDYFGFNLWSELGREARRRGAWVVEDACQAMLNDQFCESAHYVVFSPRKFIGVPDGGILAARNGAELPGRPLSAPPAKWWLDAFAASRLRAEFDRHGGNRRWFELFRVTEANAPAFAAKMSELSSLLIKYVDYGLRASKRRENYCILAAALPEMGLFASMPAGTVPLGFPVTLARRDRVMSALFAEQIYPAIHWSIDGIVPTEFRPSHHLSQTIATLPCDHRYTPSDMERLASIVRREAGA
jgi:hypothetical protein